MSDGYRFVCPRCKRELVITDPRTPAILDEEFRRAFPRQASWDQTREEICHECYEQMLKTLARAKS